MAELTLSSDAQFLKGVGPRNAAAFAKLGLHTVGDVLFNIPRRYEDRRNLPPIRALTPGQTATIKGRMIDFTAQSTRRGMVIMRAVVNDGSGSVALIWFNQPWVRTRFENYRGEIIAYGLVRTGTRGLEMSSPEYDVLDENSEPEDFAKIMPVYSLTEGLHLNAVKRAVTAAMENCLSRVPDALPPTVRARMKLFDMRRALKEVHNPADLAAAAEGRRRLVFEEFFYLQLALAMDRAGTAKDLGIAFPVDALIVGEKVLPSAASAPIKGVRRKAVVAVEGPPGSLFQDQAAEARDGVALWEQIHAILPFDLTGAQRRVIGEIWGDMKRPHPMNRLLQGDVGSGKTAVAACAMLAAVRSGYQATLMAPTEILAEQHAASLRRLFEPLGIEIVLMVGKLNSRERTHARHKATVGSGHIVVGTHALIEEGVTFHNLGLVVVDEQHKFGVLQRAALREKGKSEPDVLVMTATPIPRTLTMTVFGEMETSIIDEMPPGRKPVRTHWKPPSERDSVYAAVRKLVDEGRQAFIVCPLVSESEMMLAQAAEELYERLRREVYPDLRLGLLHGKLKPRDKEQIMETFRRGDADVLVATTVIEVGVDVPNASIMVVEDANRFGLAQLHQLRGRVGRGPNQSYCILVADATNEDSHARMEIMVRTCDGFEIAEEDLRLRGPGDVIGTRQSGIADFRFGNLVQDGLLMEQARELAIETVEKDAELAAPEWKLARERVKERRSKLALLGIS